MFWTVPLSIVRSFSLCTQQWCISYRFHPDLACKLSAKPVWYTPMLCAQWKTPDDGQRNCPKHVEFYSKNKFEKLVHLVGFIIRTYHDAQSPECQIFLCPQKIPQQMNGSDCGMFACTFAEYLCRGADITFTQQDMPYFRRKMVYEIYTCKLLMWFQHSGTLWLSFQYVCFGIL